MNDNNPLSDPEFVAKIHEALQHKIRNFLIYGLSDVGKSYFFQSLADGYEKSLYIDLAHSDLDVDDLKDRFKSSKDILFIFDHMNLEDLQQLSKIVNSNRKNIIFMISSEVAQKISRNIARIVYLPMGAALASTVVEEELFSFENRSQLKLSVECKQFIRQNHFGMRSFIASYLDILDLNYSKPSKLISKLEDNREKLLQKYKRKFSFEHEFRFPFGIEVEAIVQMDGLWKELKIGLDQGWVTVYSDAYILHGVYKYIEISEAELQELCELTKDPLRKYFLIQCAEERIDLIQKYPEIALLNINSTIKSDTASPKSIDLKELEKLPSTPLRDAILESKDSAVIDYDWPFSSVCESLQSRFNEAILQNNEPQMRSLLSKVNSSFSNYHCDNHISNLNNWHAQIHCRQGNFALAHHFWQTALLHAHNQRKMQILLCKYLAYIADLDLISAIGSLEKLLELNPTSKETLLAKGIDRIMNNDSLVVQEVMKTLEALEISDASSDVSEFMIFLGYLEQKISSPWTYLRFNKSFSNKFLHEMNPIIQYLFTEIDRRFSYCLNRNGNVLISHSETVKSEYSKRHTYDLFFDFYHEKYFAKNSGQLKIEKSRITLLLFCLLAFFPGRRFSWKELYESIYGKQYKADLDEGTIRMAVTRMKKSLESEGDSYFGISLVNQELYLKASTRYCVIISDEEIQELHKLALKLNMKPGV